MVKFKQEPYSTAENRPANFINQSPFQDALVYQLTALEVQTGPLQKQVNQSLSHLKTIQFFINNQGEAIAHTVSKQEG